MKTLFFLLLLLAVMAPDQCPAALEWERTKVELSAKPSDPPVTAKFKFKNAGRKTVTILQMVSSCGCTTAELEKKEYAPGETGEIVSKFDLGGRIGPQLKTITVLTDDPKDESTTLEFSVDIADPLTLGATLIDWKIGGEATVQKFTLKVADGYQIKVTGVKTSNEFFSAELETIKEGSEYVVKVRPLKIDGRAFGLLMVTTDYPASNPRTVYAQLRVQ